jgi:2,3-bisphosphoglycerate-independent phosphoglycerate mutase
MSRKNPIICCILDGLGFSSQSDSFYAPYCNRSPYTLVQASGKAVGLLPGMVGNSMAGHFTLGSGRIVAQPITELTYALRAGYIPHNRFLLSEDAQNSRLHIIAVLSPSGVHGSLEILYRMLALLTPHTHQTIFIHAVLDGRDAPPFAGYSYLEELAAYCDQNERCILASISGRLYALDRDGHYERTERYSSMLCGTQQKTNWKTVMHGAYTEQISDEYIMPHKTADFLYVPEDPLCILITRADRARSLVQTLQKKGFKNLITATDYGLEDQPPFLVAAPHAGKTLCETLSNEGYRIFSIAESEKYAHITYFFNGGREIIYPHETRVIIPSDTVISFAEKPALQAAKITQKVLAAYDTHDFFLINYANADMVGHTGSIPATKEALRVLGHEIDRLIAHVEHAGGTLIITADHGNAEAINERPYGMAHTMHTSALVPCIVIGKNSKELTNTLHGLADIAPWILREAGIAVPEEMVGSHAILTLEDTYE